MKRVLKMKSNLKYTILFILDLIFVFNLPNILIATGTVNAFRFNMMILITLFTFNVIAICKIEN